MSAGKKVVVALSGGVDSAVAAAMLVEQGFEVIGMTMRVFSGEGSRKAKKSCCSLEDVDDARYVAEELDIPFYTLALEEPFQQRVIDNFVKEYLVGRTPNPCLICNTDLKFGALLERARTLGAEKVATGHYARLNWISQAQDSPGRWQLRRGVDGGKDQSYALYGLTQEQLSRALFPLGDRTKAAIRKLAAKLNLPVQDKPDSQDICFIPEGNYRNFLQRQIGERILPGDFVNAQGEVLGQHRGVPFYTVGQRRGLGLQGHQRHYVTGLFPETNQVRVGFLEEAMRARFQVTQLNWVSLPAPQEAFSCQARIRHRGATSPARVEPRPGEVLQVTLLEPDPGISPGQACVFYDHDLVLGGGVINSVEGLKV
jgi:tRNA-specific 2-thiouridylase